MPCGIGAGTIAGLRRSALWEFAVGHHLTQTCCSQRRRGSATTQNCRGFPTSWIPTRWLAQWFATQTEQGPAVGVTTGPGLQLVPLKGNMLREFIDKPPFTHTRQEVNKLKAVRHHISPTLTGNQCPCGRNPSIMIFSMWSRWTSSS